MSVGMEILQPCIAVLVFLAEMDTHLTTTSDDTLICGWTGAYAHIDNNIASIRFHLLLFHEELRQSPSRTVMFLQAINSDSI